MLLFAKKANLLFTNSSSHCTIEKNYFIDEKTARENRAGGEGHFSKAGCNLVQKARAPVGKYVSLGIMKPRPQQRLVHPKRVLKGIRHTDEWNIACVN